MFRKLTVAALGAFTLGLVGVGFGSHTASAEVVYNDRVIPWTQTIDNPCEDGINLMTLSGWYHTVWYTTPDDTLMMRFSGHYQGTDSNGTKYISNTRRTMEHWDWPNIPPFTDLIVFNLVSKGGGPNAQIELTVEYSETYPVPFVRTVTCRG